jgi:hypothetical protein
MVKEVDSSNEKEHKSYDRSETRSGDTNHQRSSKHSSRRPCSISSSSPVRKHKRKNGADEIKGKMYKIKPPYFDGEHKKDEDVET